MVYHCKVEFDGDVYAIIKEAAYQAREPIRRWVARIAAEIASERTGLPLPTVTMPDELISKHFGGIAEKADPEFAKEQAAVRAVLLDRQ